MKNMKMILISGLLKMIHAKKEEDSEKYPWKAEELCRHQSSAYRDLIPVKEL